MGIEFISTMPQADPKEIEQAITIAAHEQAIARLQTELASLKETLQTRGILPPAPATDASGQVLQGASMTYTAIDLEDQYASAIADLEAQLAECDAKIERWQAGNDPEYPKNSNAIPGYGRQRDAILTNLENLRERQARSNGTYRAYLESKGRIR